MKAILVLDEMPKTCGECPYSYYSNLEDWEDETKYCAVHKGGYLEDYNQMRAVWCPLKPMPQKMEDLKDRGENHCEYSLIERLEYRKGWNACLEEIENGENVTR